MSFLGWLPPIDLMIFVSRSERYYNHKTYCMLKDITLSRNVVLCVYDIAFSGVTTTVTKFRHLFTAAYVMLWKISDFPVPVGIAATTSLPHNSFSTPPFCSSVIVIPKSFWRSDLTSENMGKGQRL